MWIFYVDEAGTAGCLASKDSSVQPVFVQAGVFLQDTQLATVTREFLELKQTFFPGRIANDVRFLDSVLVEIKGAALRKQVRGSRNESRHAVGFLEKALRILDRSEARLVGRVWVKGIGVENNARSLYTFSLQDNCRHFQRFLTQRNDQGLVIVDSRYKQENVNAAHSLFTQKHTRGGDGLDRILEMPVYGHSENHVGLQLADLLCSALLFPIACHSYCTGYVENLHVHNAYRVLKTRFGRTLTSMMFRYQEQGRPRGGFTVSDSLAKRPSSHLLQLGTESPQAPVGSELQGR